MTATPIPRTLALSAYGDLDASVIDEMPPGRTPCKSKVLSGKRGRDQAYRFAAKRLAAGERVFVVCPLVEAAEDDSTRSSWADATSVARELARVLAPASVELVHGRMSSDDRDRAMSRFRAGDAQVLVATTVVEVGLDVPQATLMIIEDANHFGLAQLHQLRGRVGRGGGDCFCLLLARGGKTADGLRRLQVMEQTTDGFVIAEEDLKLRGPGELLGARQAGLPKLRFGDLRQHAALLLKAREQAESVLSRDPDLERPEHRGARQALANRCASDTDIFGAEGG